MEKQKLSTTSQQKSSLNNLLNCARSPDGKHEIVVRRYEGGQNVLITEFCNHCKWGRAYPLEGPDGKAVPSFDSVPSETLHR
jgi:hypothetical protein